MSTLVERVSNLTSKISSKVEVRLGVYKRRELLIRKVNRDNRGVLISKKDEFIYPTPTIELIDSKLVKILDSPQLKISLSDYIVRNIPITYSYDYLFNDVEFYIINPVFNLEGTQIIKGEVCKPTMRIEESIVYRMFVLRKEIDFKAFPINYLI